MKKHDKNQTVYYEKYKPQCVEDLILPAELKNRLMGYVERKDIPNIGIFSSNPGLGKTSTANALIKDIDCEALWINASLEKGIDVLRGKILRFASQTSFDGNIKIVVMDECLEENEEVLIGTLEKNTGIKLNELSKNKIYDCVSFNMENGELENDTCEIISDKFDTIYEVMLEDGRTIKVTGNHPFIVNQNGKFIEKSINDGLCELDDIVCVK